MRRMLFFLILLLGLSLRVTGSDWGFPFLLHPDENVVANIPADMAKRGSLDPAEYNHPDHIDIYANAALYHAASRLVYHKPLSETFHEHTLLFYRISRVFVALLGTACILVAWLIGREYSRRCCVIAAALVAFFPSYVNHSHFITSDVPLTLCTLCVILFLVRYLKRPSLKNLAPAAAFSALAVSVKYPGLVTLPFILAAVLYARRAEPGEAVKGVAQGVGIFLVSLFLVSPYLIIRFDQVVRGVTANAYPVHLGADGLSWSGNLLFYVKSFHGFAGTLLTLFFLAGLYLVWKRERILAAPLFLGLLFWVGLSKIGLHWERWALPMYTCPLMVSAYGIDVLYSAARERLRQGRLALAVSAAAGFIVFNLLSASAAVTAGYTLTDTRFASYRYAQANGIREENSLYEGFTPFYPGNLRDGSVRNAYLTHDRNKELKFVILSSGVYDRYQREKQRYRAENDFYDRIFTLPLAAKFDSREYFPKGSAPFYLDNELARNLAFLADYARNREKLLTGPTILIYRDPSPEFLRQALASGAADLAASRP